MFTCAAKVDIGVSEHRNDDRALIGSALIAEGTQGILRDEKHLLAAVCDGVGGLADGFRAAEITLQFMAFLNRAGVDISALKNAIEESNRRVRKAQQESDTTAGMRTTIAGIYADGERFLVYNAGDSRVYRLRHKYLMQLSKDHSLVQDLLDLGEITPEEALTHPKKNIINKCIGHEEVVHPRVVDMSDDLWPEDLLMICSDGICDVLTNREIQEILYAHRNDPSLEDCCEALYQKAIENRSQDNLSVIVIRKEEDANE